MTLFQIKEGNLDDTDLSGTAVAFVNFFPSNLTAGGWKLGMVVNEEATDEQASALERIMKGEEGGPFEDFAALTDEWIGVERGKVSLSDGDAPTAKAEDVEYTFEPLPGPEGSGTQTSVRNAMFGFAQEFRVGRAPTKSKLFGLDFDGVYGESADYEFASEMPEGAPKGR